MKNGMEIERRYVVRAIDPAIRQAPSRRLVQGYLDTKGEESLRVRIIDDASAVFTRKRGSGVSRHEIEEEIPLDTARMLLDACGGLIVRKTRYMRDGWEVDEYEGPLQGLIIAERELASADETVVLPPWITDAVEVTDTVSNRYLAKIARDLSEGDAVREVLRAIVG